jgi:sugar phosphate isomerase/epimerase
VTLKQLKELPQEWFHFLHICDTVEKIPESKEEITRIARENRLYIGEGCIDFQSIFEQYPSIPYSIEMPHAQRLREFGYEEHARRCLDSAKRYINNHQSQPSSIIA